jgi:hypothetical protein
MNKYKQIITRINIFVSIIIMLVMGLGIEKLDLKMILFLSYVGIINFVIGVKTYKEGFL